MTSSEGTYDLQLTRYDEKRGRATFYMTGMEHSPTSATGAEELTPGDLPFLRFAPEAQELFDGWRAELERKLRADEDHPVLLSHLAKYRSLMPSLALIGSLIDAVTGGPCGPVSRAAAEQAIAWCSHLEAHARRIYATVTDVGRVAAAVVATKLAHGRLKSPFTAREVYRNEWTGLTEPRVVRDALQCLEELSWIRSETVRARDGGRPSVRFHLNPRIASERV